MNSHLERIKAHARAVRTQHREELEDASQLIAAPGVEVVVIRKPWPIGRRGRVMGVLGDHAAVDFDGKSATIPLSAIARREGGPDCFLAQIWHKTAWIKFHAGSFLA